MKFLGLLTGICLLFGMPAFAGGGGAQGDKFIKVIYVSSVGKSSNSGSSYDAALPCQVGSGALASGTTSENLWAIPANVVVRNAYMLIDTAVTSVSALDFGDTDAATSYLPAASITLGTPGLYGDADDKVGAYLQGVVNLASYSRKSKYYSAAGKYLTMQYTAGGCAAGKFRIYLEGVYLGKKPTI